MLGEKASCNDGHCNCDDSLHFKDGQCNDKKGNEEKLLKELFNLINKLSSQFKNSMEDAANQQNVLLKRNRKRWNVEMVFASASLNTHKAQTKMAVYDHEQKVSLKAFEESFFEQKLNMSFSGKAQLGLLSNRSTGRIS